jgi:hypothetical protein
MKVLEDKYRAGIPDNLSILAPGGKPVNAVYKKLLRNTVIRGNQGKYMGLFARSAE